MITLDVVVEICDLTHIYVTEQRASLAVKEINLTVRSGEFVSLIGPSGCGKTTLLSLIAGLIHPTVGKVKVNGSLVTGPSVKVGYMLQQDYLFPWRTIWENALVGLEISGQLNQASKNYVEHLLNEMGLLKFKDFMPSQLSGGMRQRVALVRTMATEPDLLLLDEPFSALDYQTKLQLEDLMVETLLTHHKTALLVTHDIAEAIAMSDRIVILEPNPGTVRCEVETPEELRNLLPLEAREHPAFTPLFKSVWEQFEAMEKQKGVASGHGGV
ncbi:ABC transporter ATP-binding protein [Paenibacillus albiflavus]|uniref:ABC transporter ATP-binding protein n=1 Tax=Paenibacillus albiflavus TaxID=2545760 RepID=A0A4V2WPX5_9BACL|nr:ABC transporter ATP-binding protein [Paenibacillus albiflavus]TCZ81072.1 ABC transporter ATP-binding protein [Paenibacillus albiflavus]